jgi:hypothetical protein
MFFLGAELLGPLKHEQRADLWHALTNPGSMGRRLRGERGTPPSSNVLVGFGPALYLFDAAMGAYGISEVTLCWQYAVLVGLWVVNLALWLYI